MKAANSKIHFFVSYYDYGQYIKNMDFDTYLDIVNNIVSDNVFESARNTWL